MPQRFKVRAWAWLCIATALLSNSMSTHATVTLTGHDLTPEQAWAVANGQDVAIAPQALEQVQKSHDLVMLAARKGIEIYGLTVGVGLNKDHHLFDAKGGLTPQAQAANEAFNRNILRSHSVGYGPMLPDQVVRLAMVIRLNTMLTGRSGAQVAVATLYKDLLNHGITPVVPSRGSIGDADITLASHVGAVMMGQWKVRYRGQVMSSAEAFKKAKLKPLTPMGKDGLAILSSNCIGVAQSLISLAELEKVLRVSYVVFGLTLEGMNGNVAPFLAQTVALHPMPGLNEAAQALRQTLEGSYLWQAHPKRALQDPLSYRTTVYTLSELGRVTQDLRELLTVQINSSDDNPAVVLNATPPANTPTQVRSYYVSDGTLKGAIIPTANFEPLPIAITLQQAAITLSHVAHNSVQRTLRLDDERFSGLTRYLASPDNPTGHAFGATEDTMVSIASEVTERAHPISMYSTPVEGNIEDSASQLPRVAQRVQQSAQAILDLYAMELLHSTQAIDLRRQQDPKVVLSHATEALYKAYRQRVPFVKEDRIYSDDLIEGRQLLENFP